MTPNTPNKHEVDVVLGRYERQLDGSFLSAEEVEASYLQPSFEPPKLGWKPPKLSSPFKEIAEAAARELREGNEKYVAELESNLHMRNLANSLLLEQLEAAQATAQREREAADKAERRLTKVTIALFWACAVIVGFLIGRARG